MCNCGPRRAVPLPQRPATGPLAHTTHPTPAHLAPARPKALFEYVGRTALTVIGPASGLRYRFDRPGARLAVDPRDHQALQAVPLLRASA
ncbi:MAG: hypothetical protein AB1430_08430 [Pseudomonadota bacterium]